LVKNGEFASYSEVVRHALREFRQSERHKLALLEADSRFVRSLASARSGNLLDFDLRELSRKR
jgi:Arc/MetJ-type ribon-helix-helix transcriptional regulator